MSDIKKGLKKESSGGESSARHFLLRMSRIMINTRILLCLRNQAQILDLKEKCKPTEKQRTVHYRAPRFVLKF